MSDGTYVILSPLFGEIGHESARIITEELAKRDVKIEVYPLPWPKDYDLIIKAAARVVSEPILSLIENDPHQFSNRPCATCAAISSIIDRPFGCAKVAAQGA